MPDEPGPTSLRFATRLSHAGRKGTKVRSFVNPPVLRGSALPAPGPLERVIAEIEGGTNCQIVSSGLAAVTTSLLAYLKSGEHCLMPSSIAGPVRAFADGMLSDLGIETTYYDPAIDAADLDRLLRSNTTVLYLESLSSQTFAPQDVPGLAAVARRHGASVLLDNTWGIHHFQPFHHDVDLSIQALTSPDVQLGAITVADDRHWNRVRRAALSLGQSAGSDDCWICLRGLRTLGVRLTQQSESALLVAEWLQTRPEVDRVLFPALPGAPGHERWKRDFTGAGSLFGVVFQPQLSKPAISVMLDNLALFGAGPVWGGFESLAMPVTGQTDGAADGSTVRFHIGLDDPNDLIADLTQAFEALHDR